MLVIPGYKLFPASTGGAYYTLVYLEKQMHELDISIIITPENISDDHLEEFSRSYPLLHVIQVGYSSKASVNKLKKGLLKLFRKTRNGNWPGKLKKTPKLTEMFIKDANLVQEIASIAQEGKYDIIQVENVINLPLVSQLPAKSLKVFVHYEVFFLRAKQDMERLLYNSSYTNYISEILKAVEVHCLNKYDGVITLSEEDNKLLLEAGVTTAAGSNNCIGIREKDLQKIFIPDSTPHLLFLGNEDHFPNKDGLTWFLQEIFPTILKEENDVKLMVTGNWSPDFKNQYLNMPVHFTGFVDSLDELLKSGILIVPVRIGAGGIHIKILTAMAKGVPIISTNIGAAGVPHIRHGHDIFITDEAANFAAHAIELLNSAELRKKMSENIFATVTKISSQGDFAAERNKSYELFEEIRISKNGK